MRASITFLLATFLLASALSVASPAAQTRSTLDIYVIDVEGGNATLFVSPSGQSLLMDTGNVNGAARDAGRIADAAKDLAEYQRLTAEGKLGEAGQKLEQLKRKLDELSAHQK